MERRRMSPGLSRLERAAGLERLDFAKLQEREKEIQSAFDTFNVQGVAQFDCHMSTSKAIGCSDR